MAQGFRSLAGFPLGAGVVPAAATAGFTSLFWWMGGLSGGAVGGGHKIYPRVRHYDEPFKERLPFEEQWRLIKKKYADAKKKRLSLEARQKASDDAKLEAQLAIRQQEEADAYYKAVALGKARLAEIAKTAKAQRLQAQIDAFQANAAVFYERLFRLKEEEEMIMIMALST